MRAWTNLEFGKFEKGSLVFTFFEKIGKFWVRFVDRRLLIKMDLRGAVFRKFRNHAPLPRIGTQRPISPICEIGLWAPIRGRGAWFLNWRKRQFWSKFDQIGSILTSFGRVNGHPKWPFFKWPYGAWFLAKIKFRSNLTRPKTTPLSGKFLGVIFDQKWRNLAGNLALGAQISPPILGKLPLLPRGHSKSGGGSGVGISIASARSVVLWGPSSRIRRAWFFENRGKRNELRKF